MDTEKLNKINHIKEKKKILENARSSLKEYFVCLDDTIDKLIDSISLWYIDSTLIERSPLISLWGATGTGKTDIIKKLVVLLGLEDQFYHLSMNGLDLAKDNYEEDFKSFQRLLLMRTDYKKENNIIFLDEFQWFNTLSIEGANVTHEILNDIWDFFSEREIKKDLLNQEFDRVIKVMEMYKDFGHYMSGYENNAYFINEIEKNTTVKKKKTNKLRDIFDEDGNSNKIPIKYIGQLLGLEQLTFLNKYLYKNKYKSLKEFGSFKIDEFIKDFDDKIKSRDPWKNLDCKHYLIIVGGNLDNAYDFCKDISNYDIDADYYSELSKRINITDVKDALKESFRDEHIARLGNNHIIFPLINKNGYECIIKRYIGEQLNNILRKHDIKINIKDEIYKMLYSNSVYPTQGARPVFTTINDFLNKVIGYFVCDAIEKNIEEIEIDYINNEVCCIGKNYERKIKYIGDIDSIKIRENKKENEKIVFAVHEAGHCIVHSIKNGYVPQKVVISTSSHYGGFVFTSPERLFNEQIENHIMTCFAGIEAEKLIFGKDNISTGSSSDIATATKLLAFLVRKSGIVDNTRIVTENSDDADLSNTNFHKTNKKIDKLSKFYREKAKEVLINEKIILVNLAEKLFKLNVMNGEDIKEFFKENGYEFRIKDYEDFDCTEKEDYDFLSLFNKIKNEIKEA